MILFQIENLDCHGLQQNYDWVLKCTFDRSKGRTVEIQDRIVVPWEELSFFEKNCDHLRNKVYSTHVHRLSWIHNSGISIMSGASRG